MAKFFTRKNPYYMTLLCLWWLILGIYSMYTERYGIGAFAFWALGTNMGMQFAGNPPDAI